MASEQYSATLLYLVPPPGKISAPMSNATAVFDEIRRVLPPSVNVFLAIESVFQTQFYPPVPASFEVQLKALASVFVAHAALLLLSLGVRARRQARQFWVFRFTRTAAGSFITPHFAVASVPSP